MAGLVPDPSSILAFADERAFESWLRKHHDSASELYLRLYKKGSGVPSISYAEALDVALCWGWIDGVKKSYDAQSFLQRFSPRRAKSVWSQINREHVARLIANKRMTEHGMLHVEAAKADGRWDAAYASGAKMTAPAELLEALGRNPKALAHYQTLDRANLYGIWWRIHTLKTAAGRAQRIASTIDLLTRGGHLHPPATKSKGERAPTAKSKKASRTK
jgi:uncharacterized protein YdeI (YjbR/CyaY-like superfamily)